MARIAVDLTPVLPGGENGGAKVMVLELIRHIAKLTRNHEFVLLTSQAMHEELAVLETDNMTRLCVSDIEKSVVKRSKNFLVLRLLFKLGRHHLIPQRILMRFKKIYFHLRRKSGFLKNHAIDLLYCPFTAVAYKESGIPVVVTLYDLQHMYYPDFFDKDDHYFRDFVFKDACQTADKMVCISDYVRDTVLKNSSISTDIVKTVHIQLCQRMPKVSSDNIRNFLDLYQLTENEFLFYPANFWHHKNHEMLFVAFSMYKVNHPNSTLKLVCTGSPSARMTYLKNSVKTMGLEKSVVFPGYITNEALSALMISCRALIFPSLFEGFGMPVLEAMALNIPVLCSNVTSLPEIVGDAAITFDPRKPHDISAAITQLVKLDNAQLNQLKSLGQKRAFEFSDAARMAKQYMEIFESVLSCQTN